jgi:hypothetical protein
MPDYRFRFNNYNHPNLVAAFDMSTLTAGGLMKNLAKTGVGFDATINGALTLAPPLIRAKKTKCMDLNRALPNWLNVANPISGLSTYSIAFWINWDAGFDGCIFSRAGGPTQFIYLYSTQILGFQDSGVGLVTTAGKQLIIGARTYFIVCTKDSSNVGSIFIDGKFFVRGTVGTVIDANALIGQYGGGGANFDGRLDNILFYNIALTPAQIQSIWRSANVR